MYGVSLKERHDKERMSTWRGKRRRVDLRGKAKKECAEGKGGV